MECDFQVGDPVVCVEELSGLTQLAAGHHGPILDENYHIREVAAKPCEICTGSHVFVKLKELVLPPVNGQEPMLGHTLFRKLLTIEDFMSKDISTPVNSEDKVPEHV